MLNKKLMADGSANIYCDYKIVEKDGVEVLVVRKQDRKTVKLIGFTTMLDCRFSITKRMQIAAEAIAEKYGNRQAFITNVKTIDDLGDIDTNNEAVASFLEKTSFPF